MNNHGKRLLEICRSADLRILNGRTSGDSLGRPTFHGKSGVSIVDYAICDQDLFHHIANFIVREPLSLLDHTPIMTWLNVNTVNDHSATTNINDTLVRLPKQFIWERDSSLKFRTELQSRDIQRMLHDFLTDNRPDRNVNTSLAAVENILITRCNEKIKTYGKFRPELCNCTRYTTAKRCLKIRGVKKRHIKSSSNKKCFDKERRLKRHELRKLANLKHRDPLNITLREGYHTVLKQYKSLLTRKKNEHYQTKISELENTVDNPDSRNFWNCLKSMDDSVKETSIPPISEENWITQFQSLHSNEPLNLHQEAVVNGYEV